MNKGINIFLIFLFSIIILSCKKSSDDSSTTSTTTEGYKKETLPDTNTVSLPRTLPVILAVRVELHTPHWINHMGFIRCNMLCL